MIRRVSSIGPYRGGFLATTVAEGAELGPELVVNGGLSEGLTGWETASGAVANVTDGRLSVTTLEGDAISAAYQGIAFVPGKTYRISIELVAFDKHMRFGTTSMPTGTFDGVRLLYDIVTPENKVYSTEFVAGTETMVSVAPLDGPNTVVVDNLSVREVIPTWRYR